MAGEKEVRGRRLQVIPAVDLLGEDAVRLEQGDVARVLAREHHPTQLVERFAAAGAPLIHVVDLDGARRGVIRPELVRELAAAASPALIQASGGIRSADDAKRLLAAGAARVVVGTAAFAEADSLERWADSLGEQVVVAVDVRGGRVAVSGWERVTELTAEEAAERCAEAGVPRLLCTAIERDGTLAGPDVELLRCVCAGSGLPVLAAGGVRSEDDLAAVEAAGCEGAIVGRALLEGRLPLSVLARSGARPS
jgi:phosphoribosylformimino-5-aminoimidazole carboxamide ribotide isomerase